MFQDLSKKINLENIASLKAQNSRTRYLEPGSAQPNLIKDEDEDEDNSLDDLHFEVEERKQLFDKANIENQQDNNNDYNFLKRNDQTPKHQRTIKKLTNQLALSYQKQKMIDKTHRRELQYQQELYKRRQQWLNCEISRLKSMLQKYKENQKQIKGLKKQVFELRDLKEMIEVRLENEEKERQYLKNRIMWYEQVEFNRKQQNMKSELAVLNTGDHKKEQKQIRMALEREIQEYKRICGQKQNKIEQLHKNFKRKAVQYEQRQTNLQQRIRKIEGEFQRKSESFQTEIISLRKRNQSLEETFIQRMSQITKIQANMFSNSNLSAGNIHRMSQSNSKHEQTLNLHEQSPIRPTSNNLSEKKPHKNGGQRVSNPQARPVQARKRIYSRIQEKSNTKLHTSEQKCQFCEEKINKLKNKLETANKKLVELLEEKAKMGKKDKLFETQGRTRIMSWANKAF